MLVHELAPDTANGTREAVANNTRASRDDNRIGDNVCACREVNKLAAGVHGQDRVDVGRVVCRAITVDRSSVNGFYVNDLARGVFLICWLPDSGELFAGQELLRAICRA